MFHSSKYYRSLYFDKSFNAKKEGQFEDFFATLMEMAFQRDFQRVRPNGSQGDGKCDGYQPSKKKVFQCYAPKKFEAAKAIRKIEEDFKGAIHHWGNNMQGWVFVHNDKGGLPHTVTLKLAELRQANSGITIDVLGYSELKELAMKLSRGQLARLLEVDPGVFGISLYMKLLAYAGALSLIALAVKLFPFPGNGGDRIPTQPPTPPAPLTEWHYGVIDGRPINLKDVTVTILQPGTPNAKLKVTIGTVSPECGPFGDQGRERAILYAHLFYERRSENKVQVTAFPQGKKDNYPGWSSETSMIGAEIPKDIRLHIEGRCG